jgi:hypothetical protein
MRYKGLVDWSAPNVAPTVPPAAAARELPDLSNGDTNVAEARKATMWRVGAGKAKTRGAGAAASRAKTRRAAASKCEATWVEGRLAALAALGFVGFGTSVAVGKRRRALFMCAVAGELNG